MKFLDAYYEARRDNKMLKHDYWDDGISATEYTITALHGTCIQVVDGMGWQVVDKPKPQPKFKIYDTVKTPKGFTGEVKGITLAMSGFTYGLHFDNETAAWFDESELVGGDV
jgi:hypothetical protein